MEEEISGCGTKPTSRHFSSYWILAAIELMMCIGTSMDQERMEPEGSMPHSRGLYSNSFSESN